MEIRRREIDGYIQLWMAGQKLTHFIKQFIHHVVRDTGNHAFIFRQRNKLRRVHHRTVKPVPAQQRFRPNAAVIFNIDNRLVVQAQLAAAQSPLQHIARRVILSAGARPHQHQ